MPDQPEHVVLQVEDVVVTQSTTTDTSKETEDGEAS